MNTWQWLGLMMAVAVHTAALFRWGGRMDILIRDHDREINALRVAKHDLNNKITAHELEIENIKEDVSELKKRRGK